MSHITLNVRPALEELDARVTPAVVVARPHIGVEPQAALVAQADDAPLHVSLAAVAAITLCICFDRRTRKHGSRRRLTTHHAPV